MHKETAIDCLNNTTFTRDSSKLQITKCTKLAVDAKTIDNLVAVDSSVETTELIQRWKEIVKPGIYRMTGGKWKK